MALSKLLVANRGEIAVRVARTCAELGIGCVAVHSDPDAGALHVRVADEAVPLGGTLATDNYLDIGKLVDAAVRTGCDAVHPGYGFLSENAEFARAVAAAGLIFVGPPASSIELMGEKVAAREAAHAAGVPVVPGTAAPVESAEEIRAFGAEHGFPIAIKASYGGGGRGMRIVESSGDADAALASARREALASFGRAEVYLERYLTAARHVEVQVFADANGHAAWLGDRDCSVQRRHQKLVEESPAPGLPAKLRAAMGEASVRLARAVDYVGAGTVEYLVEGQRFYFLEMNTRIQVEHPVTEAVLGIDLVAEQLAVAAGDDISATESGPTPRGHAVECRINAEDVTGGRFAPAPGRIERLAVPQRVGVRFDGGYEPGDEVLPYYDSMIGKLVVWAPTREIAIRRALAVLDEFSLTGVPSTVPAARAVLTHPDFASVSYTTRWLESSVTLPERVTSGTDGAESEGADERDAGDRDEVWVAGRRYVVPYFGAQPAAVPQPPASSEVRRAGGHRSAARGGPARRRAGAFAAAEPTVTSPIQGTVVSVDVAEGDAVAANQVLFVVEAMKMENPVRAARGGTVATVKVAVGDVVAAGAELATIEVEEQ